MKSLQSNNELFTELTELFKARAASQDEEMPTVGELAAFFYGKSNDASIPRKVALNNDALEEIALYARAEQAAAQVQPQLEKAPIPAAAWEMIHRWEENEFAKPKPQTMAMSQEALNRLAGIIAKGEELKSETRAVSSQQVMVVVINKQGEISGFETFEKSETKLGDITLKHAEQSARFNNRELHALSNQEGEAYRIESFKIERDGVRVGKFMNRADYLIIED